MSVTRIWEAATEGRCGATKKEGTRRAQNRTRALQQEPVAVLLIFSLRPKNNRARKKRGGYRKASQVEREDGEDEYAKGAQPRKQLLKDLWYRGCIEAMLLTYSGYG